MTSISDTESISTIATTSTTTPKKFVCDYQDCTKSYSKPSLLQQHQRSHTGERPFACTSCDKTFLRKTHLTSHLLSHTSAKPFLCSVCGKGVNTIQHLKRHEITHTRSFKCTYPDCNESFYKHQLLRHHILSTHEKTLQCLICDKTFQRPYRLAQHNLKYHGESPAHQCEHPGCFHNFKTWSALQLHIKTEHPKLKCPVCKKKCIGKGALRSHMLLHADDDLKENVWKCNYCLVGQFPKKLDLIKHYRDHHDNNIPAELFTKNLKGDYVVDSGTSLNSTNLRIYEALLDSESEEEEMDSRKSKNLKSKKIISLILGNFSTKKIPCTYNNCDRMFSRDHDLRRHLRWHEIHLQKIEKFLEGLEGYQKDHSGEILNNIQQEEGIIVSQVSIQGEVGIVVNHESQDAHKEQTLNSFKRRKIDIQPESLEEEDVNLDELIDNELLLLKAGGLRDD